MFVATGVLFQGMTTMTRITWHNPQVTWWVTLTSGISHATHCTGWTAWTGSSVWTGLSVWTGSSVWIGSNVWIGSTVCTRLNCLDRLKCLDRLNCLDCLKCLDRFKYLHRLKCLDRLNCVDWLNCLDRDRITFCLFGNSGRTFGSVRKSILFSTNTIGERGQKCGRDLKVKSTFLVLTYVAVCSIREFLYFRDPEVCHVIQTGGTIQRKFVSSVVMFMLLWLIYGLSRIYGIVEPSLCWLLLFTPCL